MMNESTSGLKYLGLLMLLVSFLMYNFVSNQEEKTPIDDGVVDRVDTDKEVESIDGVYKYSGETSEIVHSKEDMLGNVFDKEGDLFKTDEGYTYYAPLDELGRVTLAEAIVSEDTFPTEKRKSISHVKPSGWLNKEYVGSNGKKFYLYNRSHLIGHQLTGENALKENLMTGTREFNVAMIPFENSVKAYIDSTGDSVAYRVTPYFTGTNLLADYITLDFCNIELPCEEIGGRVVFYNVQEGIELDYATGDSQQVE